MLANNNYYYLKVPELTYAPVGVGVTVGGVVVAVTGGARREARNRSSHSCCSVVKTGGSGVPVSVGSVGGTAASGGSAMTPTGGCGMEFPAVVTSRTKDC